MKKTGIIIALAIGTIFAAKANEPLKKNRKHAAKFEMAAPQEVQHTKAEKQVNLLEANRKFTAQNADKTDMDNAEGSKATDLKTRNHKLK